MSTIDDERHAFTRDLLRVLTSLYSWAGAVVHGQTEDGHDVIELCDGTRVWTERKGRRARVVVKRADAEEIGDGKTIVFMWDTFVSELIRMREAAHIATGAVAETRIRDLLTGPP